MVKAILKWALILGCLFAVGPLVARMLMELRDADGGRAVTLLLNAGIGKSLLCTFVLLAAAGIVGVVGSRYFSLTTGMACAGFVLAWASSSLGSLESLVRRTGDGGSLTLLAIEGLIVTCLAAAMTLVFVRVAGARSHDGEVAVRTPPAPGWMGWVAVGDVDHRDKAPAVVLGALAAGVIVAAIFVWLLALSGARMQTLAAAAAGAIAAGAVAQVMTAARPFALTPVVPMLAVAMVALMGPLITRGVEGSQLLAHVYDGTVLNLARPVSLDWAAGALIGVPLGMGWAGAGTDRRGKGS